MKGDDYMLGYRITIQGNTEGEVIWDVTFQSENGKFDSAATTYIGNTAEKLADALKALSFTNP